MGDHDRAASGIALRARDSEPYLQGGDDRRTRDGARARGACPPAALFGLGRGRRRDADHRQHHGRRPLSGAGGQCRRRGRIATRGADRLGRHSARRRQPVVGADQPSGQAMSAARQHDAARPLCGAARPAEQFRPAARGDRRRNPRHRRAVRARRGGAETGRIRRRGDPFGARLSSVAVPFAANQPARRSLGRFAGESRAAAPRCGPRDARGRGSQFSRRGETQFL